MQPGPYEPIPYGTGEPASGRPTSVTVISIIAIILSSLALICLPISLVPYMMQIGPPNPALDQMRHDPLVFPWTILSVVIGFFASIVLLVAAIGSLRLRPLARKVMVGYSIFTIFWTILGLVVTLAIWGPRLANAVGAQRAQAIGGIIGGCVGGAIGLILPLFIFIYFRKPHVIAAFEQGGTDLSSAAGSYPIDPLPPTQPPYTG